MASNRTEMVDLAQQTGAVKIDDFYAARKENRPVTFARLEKGLLLFLDVYEQSKTKLASEMALWDHQLCYDKIQDGQCQGDRCSRIHETKYRQTNLCLFWYRNNSCRYDDSECQNRHHFEEVSLYHNYIRTETDANVYKLIRFIRNSVAHCFDLKIDDKNDQQDLYKQMIVIMVYLVHFLSPAPKQEDSVEHLTKFLEKKTITQLIPQEDLLIDVEKPCDIPEIFFKRNIDFNSIWYQRNGSRRCVDFKNVSNEFVECFNYIFIKYYKRRLESRGTQSPW